MDAIQIVGLTKKYKELTAVNGLNLTVGEGELFALLGVNGAGKTTTIKMLCCLTRPTEGQAFLCGRKQSRNGRIPRTEATALPSSMTTESFTPR